MTGLLRVSIYLRFEVERLQVTKDAISHFSANVFYFYGKLLLQNTFISLFRIYVSTYYMYKWVFKRDFNPLQSIWLKWNLTVRILIKDKLLILKIGIRKVLGLLWTFVSLFVWNILNLCYSIITQPLNWFGRKDNLYPGLTHKLLFIPEKFSWFFVSKFYMFHNISDQIISSQIIKRLTSK